ncbi:MAG: N-acetylglucosamine-6-phosphate deacetylase, partial [Sulfitobacter sp.]
MTQTPIILTGARIHDGHRLHDDVVLQITADGSAAIQPAANAGKGSRLALDEGIIIPGFVDLQVNGGDGIMFNDAPTLETLRRIARAHWSLGCAAILPTLITDTPAKTQAAIDATIAAIKEQ